MTVTTERAAAARARGAGTSPELVLAIVCAGVVLASLDMFIVNVALPSIARDFGSGSGGLAGLSWVLNGYSVVYAALLVPAGRLADRSSRRRGFLFGVGLFTLASGLCATAPNVGTLVAFRILQAVGAAALTPTSLGLVLGAFPAERRGGAVRIWTAMGGLAAALGPVVGGLLVTADWRWVFLVNVPIGLAALVAGARLLPDSPPESGPRPDVLSGLALTAGVAALVGGLVTSGEHGWTSGLVIGLLVAAAVLLAGMHARSARHASPIIELDLVRDPVMALTLFSTLLFSGAFGAMLLSVTLWMQEGWGWSALRAGLGLAPGPLMVPPLAIAAGGLIRRFGPGPVLATGAVIFGGGVAWWALGVGLHPHYAGELLGGAILTGVGVGLTLPTLFSTAAAALPPARFATGSALVNMVRQIGFAIGVAIFVAVLGNPASPAARLDAFRHGWWATAAMALAAAVAALGLLRLARTRRSSAPGPDPVRRPAAVDGPQQDDIPR